MIPLDLPDEVFAAARPVVDGKDFTRLAARLSERLAVLERLRPLLTAAIQASREPEALALLAVRINQTVLKGE